MLFKDIDNIDTNVVSILSQSGITDMTDVQAKTSIIHTLIILCSLII